MANYSKGRPAETASLGVGGMVLAVFAILQGYGIAVPKQVPAATNVLVGGVAAVVSWWINRRDRQSQP